VTKVRLLLVILEGQAYLAAILVVFLLQLAFLGWGLWSRRPVIGLIAVFVTVPLLRSTVGTIRALFRAPPPADGLRLDPADGRRLHDVVDDVRRAAGVGRIHDVVVTGGFNASAVVCGPLWARRRTLIVGLPALATLSDAELGAVVAHEVAHFRRSHAGFATWVYRTRRSWFDLRRSLDRRLATPIYVYWLLYWYVPRLDVLSAAVARTHEFDADALAASIAGARTAADALVVFEAAVHYANVTFWPAIVRSPTTMEEPPRPFRQMLTWRARIADGGEDLLADLVASGTAPDDSHPSLRERFASLGIDPRIPPYVPPERSAGASLLGPYFERLADALDEEWLSRHGERWREERAEHVESRASLQRLEAIADPSPDEIFARAELVERLRDPADALRLYLDAHARGHARAGLAAGRLRLADIVESAMDRDDTLVPEGCRLLAEHYRETSQELAARRCEWRANGHLARAGTAPS
jgi:Zn-dependent protease with chaperone function